MQEKNFYKVLKTYLYIKRVVSNKANGTDVIFTKALNQKFKTMLFILVALNL